MPIGEIVGEIILKPILEIIAYLLFYTLGFWTGFVFLEFVSLGKLNLATPEKFGDRSKHPKRKNRKAGAKNHGWFRRNLWIYKGERLKSELKPEVTATVGLFLAFPEIVLTSSEKGDGIPTLRSIIANLE